MLKRLCGAIPFLAAILLTPVTHAADRWTEGMDYEVINPAQPTHVAAGKGEVLEVFSYGCPACNQFQPVMAKLEKSLPANAQLVYLPASFVPAEDWIVFQRAYITAQSLGIAARTHQALFDAIWETGELQTIDSDTHRLKSPMPSILDVAQCYERLTGVKASVFLAAAQSPAIDARMKAADAQIVAMHVSGTPGLVVNGKYRILMDSIHTQDDLNDLVAYLLKKDSKH